MFDGTNFADGPEPRPTEVLHRLREAGVEIDVDAERPARQDPSVLQQPPLNNEQLEKHLKR